MSKLFTGWLQQVKGFNIFLYLCIEQIIYYVYLQNNKPAQFKSLYW